MTFEEWYDAGIDNNWVLPFCAEHGSVPLVSEAEAERIDAGDDPLSQMRRAGAAGATTRARFTRSAGPVRLASRCSGRTALP